MKHPSNLAAVRAMFGDAVRDGLVDINPLRRATHCWIEGAEELVALTETELHELAGCALDERMELGEDYGKEYRAMVLFAGYVGLRPRRTICSAPGRCSGAALHN